MKNNSTQQWNNQMTSHSYIIEGLEKENIFVLVGSTCKTYCLYLSANTKQPGDFNTGRRLSSTVQASGLSSDKRRIEEETDRSLTAQQGSPLSQCENFCG